MIAAGIERTYLRGWQISVGAADDLAAAGLVQPDKLPGRPGQPRGMLVQREGDGPVTRIVAKKTLGQVFFEVWRQIGEAQVLAEIAAELAAGERLRSWPFPVVAGEAP